MNQSYILRNIISALFMPLAIFWILLLTGTLLFWVKKRKSARNILIFSLVWLAGISFSPLPYLLTSSLENRYKPLTELSRFANDSSVHIIVLGGGHESDPSLPANNQLSLAALGRLAEGIRIHRLLPGSLLITSGWQVNDTKPQALVQKETAILLGIPPAEIRTLVKPVNTEEEAQCYAKEFGKSHKLVVVTDAAHMPRAIMWFRKAGLVPVAAPTNHMIKQSPGHSKFNLFPSSDNIARMEYAVHEYIGILWFKIK
jgi:uncharacterized SAM-binding protein YcdF (DUF218 family)